MSPSFLKTCRLRISGRGCRGDVSAGSCSSCVHNELLGMYKTVGVSGAQGSQAVYGGGYSWQDLQRALQLFDGARSGAG